MRCVILALVINSCSVIKELAGQSDAKYHGTVRAWEGTHVRGTGEKVKSRV